MSILGTRVLRTEDPRFLTTGGVYTEDVVDERLDRRLPRVLRPLPGRARQDQPGSTSVPRCRPRAWSPRSRPPTSATWPAIPPGRPDVNQQMAQPLLAADKVRFVGDPVAIVVTEQAYQGEDAVELVDVDYDPLPAVHRPDRAPIDEVLLFEEAGTNVAATFGDPSTLDEHLFDDCEVVVSRTIINQRVAPAPMETRAAAAAWGEDGRLTAWIPNQGAQGTTVRLARLLGVRASRCGSSPPTSAARSAPSSAPTPSTRSSPGWRGGSAARRGGPRPGTRT